MTNQSTPANSSVNISDLESVVRIIDAASERGAFKGSELSSVGTVRDKIANFLTQVAARQAEAAEAAKAAEATQEAPSTKE